MTRLSPTPASKLIPVLVGFLLCAVAAAHAGWETARYNGNDYVTVRSIKEFYNFDTMKRTNKHIVLENKAVEMRLTTGGQEVWMNNVKFVFSYPVVYSKGRYLVSRIDLAKLVDPVLRPQYIRRGGSFTTVIIDPGHGGKDSGATNRYGTEKAYNLIVARKLKAELEARKFKVIMTRDSDRYLSLQERVDFANRFTNAVFISIHFNSGGRGRAEGIETFTLSPVGVAHYGRGLKDSDFQAAAGNSQDSANIALATAVHSTTLLMTGRPDRGIRRARYSVLTGVRHPAILLEGGFMSHPFEARLIDNSGYQNTVAKGIANAVVKYKMATERLTATRR
ncbi:MAG: N-acetylmuramoyl-L-alanine amidase [Akkermansiaceae bacterium]|nr:N-acetylmuramoyl-L-alanine amidase [Akkermansiaceae bacterium]NNM30834.1 N-acetylmuramoyl-L-alanine amidase [Akkermansiaceae bacterium]